MWEEIDRGSNEDSKRETEQEPLPLDLDSEDRETRGDRPRHHAERWYGPEPGITRGQRRNRRDWLHNA